MTSETCKIKAKFEWKVLKIVNENHNRHTKFQPKFYAVSTNTTYQKF